MTDDLDDRLRRYEAQDHETPPLDDHLRDGSISVILAVAITIGVIVIVAVTAVQIIWR